MALDEHLIHRLDEFVPHLARLQPSLIELLPEEERPVEGLALADWVVSLPQSRLMEICSLWVMECFRLLRERSPLTNVLMRGALMLPGEFDVCDVGMVSIGELLQPGDPRRIEAQLALDRAARHGLLIHLGSVGRYCVPFPVRLSMEGIEFLEPLERDEMRFRMVERHAVLAEEMFRDEPDAGTHRHWRFVNMLAAYEMAVDMLEEATGLEGASWFRHPAEAGIAAGGLATPLLAFARFLGRELVQRHSERGERLLASAVVAANNSCEELAAAYAMLGQFHMRRSRYPRALEFFERMLALRRESGDTLAVTFGLSAVAICLREMGERRRAADLFIEANVAAREAMMPDQQLDTANCGALLLIDDGVATEAAALLEQTLEQVGPTAATMPQVAETLLVLGRAYIQMRQLDGARATLTRAIAAAERLANHPAEARARMEMGRLSAAMGDHEAAEELLETAAAAFAEIGDHSARGEARVLLARTRLARGVADGVERLVYTALQDAQRSNDHLLEGEAWRVKSELAEFEGDQRALVKALDNEVRALRRTRSAQRLVDLHLRLGALYTDQEAPLVAGMEYLRAQAILRAVLPTAIPPRLDALIADLQQSISPEEWEFLLRNVSDEIDNGQLVKQ